MRKFRPRRAKFCPFKSDPKMAEQLTYRNPDLLRRYISEDGKILPRRTTGVSAKYQRKLALEIERARILALLPFRSSKPRPRGRR